MANNTEKRRYLAADVGTDAKGHPHAFHLEGYISKPAYFKEATDEKSAYLGTSMGISVNPERLMALADGTYDKTKDYGSNEGSFVTLNVFGKEAESFSKVCNTGVRVAVTGTLEWNTYSTKDGTDARELRIRCNKVVVMGGKGVEAEVSPSIAVSTNVYTGKDGVQRSVNYAELMTGEVIGCRGLAEGGTGKKYLSFGVKTKMPAKKICDLANGTYNKDNEYDDKKRIVNAVVFDRAAEAMANVLRDGAMVVLTGPVTEREYNGDTSYQMRPRVVSIMKFAPRAEGEPADGAVPAGSVAAAGVPDSSGFVPLDEDDGDELPF